MADKIEETIREIAAKHGIAVGRDDPILILQTLNEMLMRDTAMAQQNILDGFKAELEAIAFRWGEDARNKAERTLSAAVAASRDLITQSVETSRKATADATKVELNAIVDQIEKLTRENTTSAWINLLAAMSFITTAGFFLYSLI